MSTAIERVADFLAAREGIDHNGLRDGEVSWVIPEDVTMRDRVRLMEVDLRELLDLARAAAPLVVTSTEEVAGLPKGSVIRDADGDVMEYQGFPVDWAAGDMLLFVPLSAEACVVPADVVLPAVVLR